MSDIPVPVEAPLPVELALPAERPPFWRRLIAISIDGVVLGIWGIAMGLFAGEWLEALGPWGRLAGGAAGVCYFAICASALTRGQSVGKKIMRIAVVRRDGGYLSLPASLARATLIMLPIACNGLAVGLTNSFVPELATVAVFGLGGALTYLFVFNRETRECVHDLATRSAVVRVSVDGPAELRGSIWRGHFVVLGVLFVAGAIAGIATSKLASTGEFAALRVAQSDIARTAHTQNVQIFYGSTSSTRSSSTWVRASVMTYSRPADEDKLANAIAAIVLRDIPLARSRSSIFITITDGYDIVFASAWKTRAWSFTPAEWQSRIKSRT